MRRIPLFTHRRRVLPITPSSRGFLESSCCTGTTPTWREYQSDSVGKATRKQQETRNNRADASLAAFVKTLPAVGQREQSRSRVVASSLGGRFCTYVSMACLTQVAVCCLEARRVLSHGQVDDRARNHVAIAFLSKVCPQMVVTRSVIMSCVMEHMNSFGTSIFYR